MPETGGNLERKEVLIVTLLILGIVSCSLPWVTAHVDSEYLDITVTNNGFDYIAPLGAKYAAPVAILSVIGFILVGYSFITTRPPRKMIVLGGLLMLVGAGTAFIYTAVSATSEASESSSYLVIVEGRYGMGLEVLFGILVMIAGLGRRRVRRLVERILNRRDRREETWDARRL